MNYDDVIAYLERLQMHKIKLGLEAMQNFLAKVGRPETAVPVVHLAGTNGKGTVCAVVSGVLQGEGYRVGVYTSPHLSSVRERFRINNTYISEDDFARIGTLIYEMLNGDHITYFEFTTALGMIWFAENELDLVLLETGMGGRLDATNVVSPLVSVIASISLDHEAYLGNTIEEIAGEKAGIIKDNVPVIASVKNPKARAVIEEKCREKNSELYLLDRDFSYETRGDCWELFFHNQRLAAPDERSFVDLRSNSISLAQQENESLACAVLLFLKTKGFRVSREKLVAGVKNVSWPGRMESFSLEWEEVCQLLGMEILPKTGRLQFLLDGAHNPAGVENLALTLKKRFAGFTLVAVWGAMADKDLEAVLAIIEPLFDKFVFVRANSARAAVPEKLYDLLGRTARERAVCGTTVKEAVSSAVSFALEAGAEKSLVVIAGSLYLVGDVRKLLLGELVS